MMTKRSGTCFLLSPDEMNAWMLSSWVEGCLVALKVASINQLLAHVGSSIILSVAKRRWWRSPTVMSLRKKSSGREFSTSLKSRLVGFLGQRHCQCQLAALARLTSAGREDVGSLLRFSSKIFSVISAAAVKMS